jgi:hypothetical protein
LERPVFGSQMDATPDVEVAGTSVAVVLVAAALVLLDSVIRVKGGGWESGGKGKQREQTP